MVIRKRLALSRFRNLVNFTWYGDWRYKRSCLPYIYSLYTWFAWGVVLSCTTGLPEPLKQIILTVPRLNRNRVCINLIYSYYILFFSRFDTVKFPFLLFSQKTIFCKCLWFFVGRWNNNRATIDRKGNKSYKETAFLLSS